MAFWCSWQLHDVRMGIRRLGLMYTLDAKFSLEHNQTGRKCELEEEENIDYDRYGQSKRRRTKNKKLRTEYKWIGGQITKNVRNAGFG
jgi:hypothetical protein